MRFDRWGAVDTSPEAERLLFRALRRLTPDQRLQRAASLTDAVRAMKRAVASRDAPDGPDRR